MTTQITIATPMFGGSCSGHFTKSLLNAFINLGQHDIQVNFIDLYNESLITRARNILTHVFLESDSDYLLFIDADQSFKWEDIVRMLEHDKEVIASTVPMKRINWDLVKHAANNGVAPESLELFSGYFNVNFHGPDETFEVSEPAEVKYAGTGMILIKREVFEKVSGLVEEYTYDGGAMGSALIPGETKLKNYWDTTIKDGRLLSEDYYFSSLCRDAEIPVYVDLQSRVLHHGTYPFSGSLLAQIPEEEKSGDEVKQENNTPKKKAPSKKVNKS